MGWEQIRRDAEGRLAALCLALPDVYEQPAPNGRSWLVRSNHFCQVHTVDNDTVRGWTQARLTFAEGDEAGVMIFRSRPPELDALAHAGRPFFKPGWGPRVIGMVIDDDTDWDEVGELIVDSYCIQAPKKLAALVTRRPR